MQRPPRRKISRAVDWILGKHPFLASTVCHFEISQDDSKTDSAATDGRRLYFNGPFMDKLTQLEASWVILHEAGHVFLGHHLREKGKTQHGVWNEAADLALNELIKNEPGFKHNEYALAGEGDYADLPSGKALEWYYGRLTKEVQKPKPEPGQEQGPGNQPGGDRPQQGQGDGKDQGNQPAPNGKGNGKGKQKVKQPGEVLPAENPETAKREWEQMVAEGLQHAKSHGSCPGWVRELVDKVLAPPVPDTKQILRQFFSRTIRQGTTYSKPNRRRSHLEGVILPARRSKSLGDVALIVDTSGSMSTSECNMALRWIEETVSVYRGARITAIQADTRVIEEATKTYTAFDFPVDAHKVCWHGRGGTDLAPAIVAAAKLRPSCIVVVSDMEWGYGSCPDPRIPTLWIETKPTGAKPRFGIIARMGVRTS